VELIVLVTLVVPVVRKVSVVEEVDVITDVERISDVLVVVLVLRTVSVVVKVEVDVFVFEHTVEVVKTAMVGTHVQTEVDRVGGLAKQIDVTLLLSKVLDERFWPLGLEELGSEVDVE